jgi:hypothetical protein
VPWRAIEAHGSFPGRDLGRETEWQAFGKPRGRGNGEAGAVNQICGYEACDRFEGQTKPMKVMGGGGNPDARSGLVLKALKERTESG